MGYWTEYFSTLLKGLRVTALKERIEVRKTINNLREADRLLYVQIKGDVEDKHLVTQAIKEQTRLLDELKKSVDNAYNLAFNLTTEELTLLKTSEEILSEFEKFSENVGRLAGLNPNAKAEVFKLEKAFAELIIQALKKGESEERDEYKQVMLIINESHELDMKRFLAAVRLAFQKESSQSILAKFAMRREIRVAKVDILKLQQMPARIRALRQQIGQKGKSDAAIAGFNKLIDEFKHYCNDAFYQMFILMKRDLLVVLKVLFDLHNLREFNIKWERQHYMPRSEVLAVNKRIVEMQTEIGRHFQTLAQGFRNIITMTQRLGSKAGMDLGRLVRP